MPIFLLDDETKFPDPKHATKEGLLAVGGDLSVERLVGAYKKGIFPWYSDDSPILWWSPDPRMILFPEKFKRSKSLTQVLKRNIYQVTFDRCFDQVIRHCAYGERKEQPGTWITEEMIDAYIDLHKQGYAHSAESWYEGKLAGGLYGVSIGRAFFGESMFFIRRDASKVALSFLVDKLLEWNFLFIDAQQQTEHMRKLGALPLPRNDFLVLLHKAIRFKTRREIWE
jgi:leucyl/phenylalanyl-tRNA--protein transferase